MKTLLGDYKVFHTQLTSATCVGAKTSLKETLELMRSDRIGCALVMSDDGKEMTHIFTERDFLKKIAGQDIDWNDSVSKYGTESPMAINIKDPLLKAFEIMKANNFRHLPVIDADKKTRYVLSIRRIIELVAEHFPAEILNLPPRLSQTASTREGG